VRTKRYNIILGLAACAAALTFSAASVTEAAVSHASRPAAANPPAAQRVYVAIQWNPAPPRAEHRLWAAYLYTRAAFVAAQSGRIELPLGEHTASFEEEVRGRLIAVYLYRQMRRAQPAFRSAYFAALSRVQAAGYLREYAWRYLRAASWRRPDGLRLAAFDEWRAVHLRHHVPQTYGRIDIVPLAPGPGAQVAAR
jgi:hypothetical protein